MAQRPDREPGQTLIARCQQPADERLPDLASRTGNQNPLHVYHDQIMNLNLARPPADSCEAVVMPEPG